jgi:uncharacterized protein DUF1173
MQPRHAHRVKVLVAGETIEAPAIRHDPKPFQATLQAARERYGAAKCLCQSPPLSLVIREREGKLFLAAWPNDAQHHALDCPFYGEVRTGATEYSDDVIASVDERTSLALGHQLLQADRNAGSEPDVANRRPAPAKQGGQRKGRLHIWGLLHYLWESGGLNRWYPGWTRDWGFVRYALRRAAQSTDVDSGEQLLAHLYVPPVWSEARKDEIRRHWRAFCDPLFRNHRRNSSVASGFVIGLVRELDPTEFGYALKLHHHSERFWLDTAIADNLARYSRRGWAALKHLEVFTEPDEKPYVVAALRVEATHTKRLTIVEAALMRVSPRFIPVNSSYEDRLARVLVEQDRQFVRPLHYDNHTMELPDFILKDVDRNVSGVDENGRARPTALHVYGAAIDPIQRDRLVHRDSKAAHSANMAYWQWDASTDADPPALPPARPHAAAAPASAPSHPAQPAQQESPNV